MDKLTEFPSDPKQFYVWDEERVLRLARWFCKEILWSEGIDFQRDVVIEFAPKGRSSTHYGKMRAGRMTHRLRFGVKQIEWHFKKGYTEYKSFEKLVRPNTIGMDAVYQLCIHECSHAVVAHEHQDEAYKREWKRYPSGDYLMRAMKPHGFEFKSTYLRLLGMWKHWKEQENG